MKGFAGILVGLTLLIGCGPKHLDTRINKRKTVSMVAEAKKDDGLWRISLRLPAGQWKVESQEDQRFAITQEASSARQIMNWTVTPERWRQGEKPLYFNLVGENDIRLEMSVRYAEMFKEGDRTWLSLLGLWLSSM